VLGRWKFNYTDIFSIAGIPLFVAVAWIPEVVIYAYFLKRVHDKNGLLAYLGAFSLATGLYVHWLYKVGFMEFIRWNSLLTVTLAFLLHLPVTYYVIKTTETTEETR